MNPGDLVEVTIDGRERTAVILDTCLKAELDIIHYNFEENRSFLSFFREKSRVVRKETITLDCKGKKVLKHEYDESLVHPPAEVVNRAEKRIGERNWKFCSYWSSNFAADCKLRPERNSEQKDSVENRE